MIGGTERDQAPRGRVQGRPGTPRPALRGERAVALFVLGLLAFSPPLLAIFSHAGFVLGVPVLYFYLFCVWAGLILLIGLNSYPTGADGFRGGLRPGARE
jgi:hypothetical protein